MLPIFNRTIVAFILLVCGGPLLLTTGCSDSSKDEKKESDSNSEESRLAFSILAEPDEISLPLSTSALKLPDGVNYNGIVPFGFFNSDGSIAWPASASGEWCAWPNPSCGPGKSRPWLSCQLGSDLLNIKCSQKAGKINCQAVDRTNSYGDNYGDCLVTFTNPRPKCSLDITSPASRRIPGAGGGVAFNVQILSPNTSVTLNPNTDRNQNYVAANPSTTQARQLTFYATVRDDKQRTGSCQTSAMQDPNYTPPSCTIRITGGLNANGKIPWTGGNINFAISPSPGSEIDPTSIRNPATVAQNNSSSEPSMSWRASVRRSDDRSNIASCSTPTVQQEKPPPLTCTISDKGGSRVNGKVPSAGAQVTFEVTSPSGFPVRTLFNGAPYSGSVPYNDGSDERNLKPLLKGAVRNPKTGEVSYCSLEKDLLQNLYPRACSSLGPSSEVLETPNCSLSDGPDGTCANSVIANEGDEVTIAVATPLGQGDLEVLGAIKRGFGIPDLAFRRSLLSSIRNFGPTSSGWPPRHFHSIIKNDGSITLFERLRKPSGYYWVPKKTGAASWLSTSTDAVRHRNLVAIVNSKHRFDETMAALDRVEFYPLLFPGVYAFNQAANAPSLGQAALWTIAGVGDVATFGVGSSTRLVAAGCKAAVVTGAVARVTNFGITPNFNNGVDAAIGVLEGSFVAFRMVKIKIRVDADGEIKGYLQSLSSSAAGAQDLARFLGKRVTELADTGMNVKQLRDAGIKPVALAIRHRVALCKVIAETGSESAPMIFWAGKTAGATEKIMNLAAQFAGKINGMTLEMFLEKAGVLDPKVLARLSDGLDGTNKFGWDKLGESIQKITGDLLKMPWNMVSRSLARKASGKVYAVLGDDLLSDATFFKELRELIANPKVTELVIVSPKQLANGAWDFTSQTTAFRRCGFTGQVTLDPGAMISQTVEGQAGVLRQRLKDLIEKAYPESCKQIPVNPVTCSAN